LNDHSLQARPLIVDAALSLTNEPIGVSLEHVNHLPLVHDRCPAQSPGRSCLPGRWSQLRRWACSCACRWGSPTRDRKRLDDTRRPSARQSANCRMRTT